MRRRLRAEGMQLTGLFIGTACWCGLRRVTVSGLDRASARLLSKRARQTFQREVQDGLVGTGTWQVKHDAGL
jgi:hypothetical protein